MLIVMMGLPATGKSTLGALIAEALDGVVLNKDVIRAAVFSPRVLDYTTEQDDLCMEMIYEAAGYILTHARGVPVVIDGRTFSRRKHIVRLVEATAAYAGPPRLIECVCDEDRARERLEGSPEAGPHVAKNRDLALYRRLRDNAEAITLPHLVVDTGELSVAQSLARCLDYVREPAQSP